MRALYGLLALLAGTAQAAPLTLASDGQARATVVLPAAAPAPLAAAAADLRQYVARLCQVDLPLRTDGQKVPGTGIYLGTCAPTTPADLPPAAANPESYAIRQRDGDLYLTGRYPTAAAFAVYALLEHELGVRWFAPGDLWEYVPPGTPGRLVIEVTPRVTAPGTSPRVWSGHAWTPSWKRWNLRNRTVLCEVVPRRQFQNNLHKVFGPQKYGQTHPEYFPLIGGKRWIPPEGNDYWRPCESNPEVIRLTVEYARQWFDTNPDIDSFSLGMDDVSHMCGCPQCRALDPHPDSYERREFSDRHYKFVNAIAREIAKSHPDRYIGTLIYDIARRPPETVPQLEPNVFGFLTETSAAWWMPGRKEEDHAIAREWAKRCRHVSRYDYYGFASLTPRYSPHHMAEQIKFDKSLGFEGMYIEVYTFLPHTAPMIWATARLQQDATLDVDALIDEYCRCLYGPAAGTMRRYLDLLERSYNTPRPGRGAWEHRNIINQALAISPEAIDEGLALLAQAQREADQAPIRQRLGLVEAALRYSSYVVKPYALSRQLATTAVQDTAGAQRLLAQVVELSRMTAEREAAWAAAEKRDDLLGETIRGLGPRGAKYLPYEQVSRLDTGGLTAALRLLGWYQANAPDQLGQLVQRLRQAAPNSDLTRAAQAWQTVREQRLPSLLQNGDFETKGANDQPAQQDWQTAGAPPGWSTWSRSGRATFTRRGGAGRNGSVAAVLGGRDGGCFLQTVPVKPGQKYLCLVWAKAAGAGHAGQLAIRYRTATAWHPNREFEKVVDMTEGADWQPLFVFVTVPPDAAGLVVMLSSGADQTEDIAFDDAAVCRLPD